MKNKILLKDKHNYLPDSKELKDLLKCESGRQSNHKELGKHFLFPTVGSALICVHRRGV